MKVQTRRFQRIARVAWRRWARAAVHLPTFSGLALVLAVAGVVAWKSTVADTMPTVALQQAPAARPTPRVAFTYYIVTTEADAWTLDSWLRGPQSPYGGEPRTWFEVLRGGNDREYMSDARLIAQENQERRNRGAVEAVVVDLRGGDLSRILALQATYVR